MPNTATLEFIYSQDWGPPPETQFGVSFMSDTSTFPHAMEDTSTYPATMTDQPLKRKVGIRG